MYHSYLPPKKCKIEKIISCFRWVWELPLCNERACSETIGEIPRWIRVQESRTWMDVWLSFCSQFSGSILFSSSPKGILHKVAKFRKIFKSFITVKLHFQLHIRNIDCSFCQIMIVDFKLTYPSGTATAHLINSFHTPEGAKLAK